MYKVQSRDELIEYVKRALGAPVLDINIDDDQIEDRIQDALDMFMDFHSEGTVLSYFKHQLTDEDIANGYIVTDQSILYVTKMFQASSTWFKGGGVFGAKYQMMVDMIHSMRNGGLGSNNMLTQWHQQQQYMEMISQTFNVSPQVTFSRVQDRLYIHGDQLGDEFKSGDWVFFEVYMVIDPEEFGDVYNNRYVKLLATQFVKRQWGQNLMKFEGMQLPGGVTLNGRQYYDDATAEIERLEEKLRLEYEKPIDFFVG